MHALDYEDRAISRAFIGIYPEYPFNEYGILTDSLQRKRIFAGMTDDYGNVTAIVAPASTFDSLYIVPYYIGLAPLYVLPLTENNINLTIGGKNMHDITSGVSVAEIRSSRTPDVKFMGNGAFYKLWGWSTSTGAYPSNFLEDDDVIPSSLITSVNNSLPENSRVPNRNPEYLVDNMDANINLIDSAEVYITFVHEGAGYKNVFGYFTYPTDSPPNDPTEIRDPTIIFPNASSPNPLQPGNKLKLWYLNEAKTAYSGVFPPNVSIGWFIIANGFSQHLFWKNPPSPRILYYSIPSFNPEATAEKRKHNLLLFDSPTNKLILGFEDLNRTYSWTSDEDFNDLVVYSTVSPITAINTNDYQESDDGVDDQDSDGVDDTNDDYPDDPNKAFNNYYPASGQYSSLAFEDLWPARGDYDFNDMVVDYRYNTITNASNDAVEILVRTRVKAIGASYQNGLGIQFNVPKANVASVSGNLINESFLSFNANGTESGQTNAVVILCDNVSRVLLHPGSGIGVNTSEGAPFVAPVEFTTTITFDSPQSTSTLGSAPFNPFIIVNKNRGVEIHLPNNEPTALADTSLFGTLSDDSDPSTGKYYVSDNYLPWALNIPSDWKHPIEKRIITNTYLKFENWATSRGESFDDWYKEKSVYRNTNFIYQNQ